MVASATAGGGKSIAGAPVIPFGQQQFGNLNEGAHTENSCGADVYTEWWTLSVAAGDRVRIDWEAQQLEYTALLVYPAGTTDFTYPDTNPLEKQELNANNKNEALITATVDGTLPVAFTSTDWSCLGGTPGPYDFTAYVQHGLSVSLKPYTHIRTSTLISASVRRVNGAPAPDGLAFNLTVSWPDHETATYAATSAGGVVAFPLALPETAKGKKATLIVSRPEDAQFLAAASAKLNVKVGQGGVSAADKCEAAVRRAHTLARQYRRLAVRVHFARGIRKRRLHRRLRAIGRRWQIARAQSAAACGNA
jgi:hypothetical protein